MECVKQKFKLLEILHEPNARKTKYFMFMHALLTLKNN